ncbi:glutathione hydrolase-like YwrD proenzyme [Haemaphysalis longicornis]
MAAADVDGNVCALLGSNARFLGCAVVEEHGFSVHTRGAAFSLTPGHVNAFGPRKKPYHSLMPVLVTDAQSHDWLCTLGTMGGISQPGFIIQLLLNMIHFGMDPQESVAKARFRLGDFFSASADAPISVEAAFDRGTLDTFKMRGHAVDKIFPDGDCFSAGHALMLCRGRHLSLRQEEEKGESKSRTSLWCGIDPRCSGIALGY